MKVRFRIFALILVASFATACQKANHRQHPGFFNSHEKQYSVAILPANVEITYIQLDGDDKRVPEAEAAAEMIIENELRRVFATKNFLVMDIDYDTLVQEYPDAKLHLKKLKDKVTSMNAEMQTGFPKDEEEAVAYENNIGFHGNVFSEYSGAELLVLSKYTGFEKSGGMVARDMAASVLLGVLTGHVSTSPTVGGTLTVNVVNGETGDLYWSNAASYRTAINEFEYKDEEDSTLFTQKSPVEGLLTELADKTLAKEVGE